MPEPRFSIVVVGDGAVGKSALTLRFLRDQFHDEYDPTIEDSYCRHIEVDEKEYTLDIIDTAGQDEYRGHWNDQFLRAGDGFICVYSITSMGSFQELIGLRDQIWRAKESEHVPMMIAANKSDLEEERQIAMKTGQEFATMSNSLYIETSRANEFSFPEGHVDMAKFRLLDQHAEQIVLVQKASFLTLDSEEHCRIVKSRGS
ncbi:hypothetical protein EDD11_002650 [Mortierella claussenii]|nr:hypothetical protein EDD11_002650 [Mortierella claussenii]